MTSSQGKIKITLNYFDNIVNIDVEAHKTVSYVKERISQIFILLNNSYKVFYQNKDISSYDSFSLSEIFKNKKLASLKITDNKHKKSQSSNFAITLPNIGGHTTRNNKILDISKFKTNTISNTNTNTIEINKPIGNTNNPKCKCSSSNHISYFCRKCNDFICDECLINAHNRHKIINVNVDNIHESLKLYSNNIQKEYNQGLSSYINNKDSDKNLYSLEKENKDVINKLDDAQKMYKNYFNEFVQKNNNHAIFNEKIGALSDKYENLTDNKNDLSVSDGKSLTINDIQCLYEKDRELGKLQGDLKAHERMQNLHRQIKDIYLIIDSKVNLLAGLLSNINNNSLSDNINYLDTLEDEKEKEKDKQNRLENLEKMKLNFNSISSKINDNTLKTEDFNTLTQHPQSYRLSVNYKNSPVKDYQVMKRVSILKTDNNMTKREGNLKKADQFFDKSRPSLNRKSINFGNLQPSIELTNPNEFINKEKLLIAGHSSNPTDSLKTNKKGKKKLSIFLN